MPEPIRPEVRTAIVAAVASGKTYRKVATDFKVSLATVSKFVNANKRAVQGPENVLTRMLTLQRSSNGMPLAVSQGSTAPFSKEERQLVEEAHQHTRAALEGVKNPFRQKFYHVDEFGYGYLDDK